MNKIILIGNVGADPEVRYYDTDQCVATLRLATTEKGYTLPNGTRVPDRTDWHNVVFYRRLAKVVEQYVHKGDKIYVDGRLQYRQYDDKRGIQRTSVDVIVDNLEMLTPKSVSQAHQMQQSSAQVQQPSAQSVQQPSAQSQQPSAQSQQMSQPVSDDVNGTANEEKILPF